MGIEHLIVGFCVIDPILLTREHGVVTLTFNRPEKMNAFNKLMAQQLLAHLTQIKRDPSVRLLVIKGAGEVFMSGSDIHEFYQALHASRMEVKSVLKNFNASILALREMDKPVIAMVHGLVMGTGMSLMLASDLVVAAEDTQFSLGFRQIATTPAGGISYHLPHLVGPKKALELLLFSDNFDSCKAQELGLINWKVPNSELEKFSRQIIDQLANGPAWAFAQTKQLINSAMQNKVGAQLKLETHSFLNSVKTRDFNSAVTAFVKKRQPEFEGR